MKILIVSLALLLAATSPAASQIFGKKKSEAPKTDSRIDSLTLANEALTLKSDSLSKELAIYLGVYTVLKEKIIHYNFDPAKTSFLIDSVRGSKGVATTAAVLPIKSNVSSDSLASMYKEQAMLKANIDTMKLALERIRSSIPPEELGRIKAISSLKQYKDLLDAKVITDEEYLTLKKKCLSNL